MMFKKHKMKQLGAFMDNETQYCPCVPDTSKDTALQSYRNALLVFKRGAAAAAHAPEINDAQFNTFMQGIREGIATPEPRFYGLWTLASLAAAALVLLISALAFLSTGSEPVRATEVESVATELEGVTIRSYDSKQGMSTVWVNMPENDLW